MEGPKILEETIWWLFRKNCIFQIGVCSEGTGDLFTNKIDVFWDTLASCKADKCTKKNVLKLT